MVPSHFLYARNKTTGRDFGTVQYCTVQVLDVFFSVITETNNG